MKSSFVFSQVDLFIFFACRRQRDIYRRSIPSPALVEDACLLPCPNEDVIILAQSHEENSLCLLFTAGEKVRDSEMKSFSFLIKYDTDLEREIDRSGKTFKLCRQPFARSQ